MLSVYRTEASCPHLLLMKLQDCFRERKQRGKANCFSKMHARLSLPPFNSRG